MNSVSVDLLQKRWAQKEQEVREELKRAKLGPTLSDLATLQGNVISVPL